MFLFHIIIHRQLTPFSFAYSKCYIIELDPSKHTIPNRLVQGMEREDKESLWGPELEVEDV